MYTIKHTNQSKKNSEYIEIENIQKTSYAKIYLNLGGSLQELVLNNHHLIKDLSPLKYHDTFASSILFPFANRIKDGTYKFNGNTYQFDVNEKKLNNAIHGLVYNKNFKVIDEQIKETYASIKLVYFGKNTTKGFPFTYAIYLEYILAQNTLDLNVEVKNTDSKSFPFTLGWHPYFLSKDLFKSSFIFDSNLKLKTDNLNITEGIVLNEHVKGFKVNKKPLDDCFILNSNKILFFTPSYHFVLTTSEKDCFLQLYIPPHPNTIAIEPTTGVSNSFNNTIGLKTLKPDDVYAVNWNIKVNNK